MSEADAAEQQSRALARELAKVFASHMLEEYLPRIAHCVSLLSEEQLWHRNGPQMNSIANLLLHLEGNVRQWILAGVAEARDTRDRAFEFAATPQEESAAGAELMRRLQATVTEAVAVVERLSVAEMLARHTFQSSFQTSVLGAVLHVMEHFSGHAGQIYFATKELAGIDLAFYDL